jgi:hypothetical protein
MDGDALCRSSNTPNETCYQASTKVPIGRFWFVPLAESNANGEVLPAFSLAEAGEPLPRRTLAVASPGDSDGGGVFRLDARYMFEHCLGFKEGSKTFAFCAEPYLDEELRTETLRDYIRESSASTVDKLSVFRAKEEPKLLSHPDRPELAGVARPMLTYFLNLPGRGIARITLSEVHPMTSTSDYLARAEVDRLPWAAALREKAERLLNEQSQEALLFTLAELAQLLDVPSESEELEWLTLGPEL